MKEKHYFMIVYAVVLIALGISLYNIFNHKSELGEQYKVFYDQLEGNINVIETNMNEITISNDNWDWGILKEINLEDKSLENTYNLLISDIRTCYLLSNDLENQTYNNIKILSFKNETSITEKQLSQLDKNDSCLKNFNKYNSLVLSDNHELSKRIKNQIRIIIDYKSDPSPYEGFAGLLYDELVTINKIANLTNWLKVEYYSRKSEIN